MVGTVVGGWRVLYVLYVLSSGYIVGDYMTKTAFYSAMYKIAILLCNFKVFNIIKLHLFYFIFTSWQLQFFLVIPVLLN